MKDRLLTIALSVAATYGLMKVEAHGPKVLDVDRLIVRKELIVSDTGVAWEKGYENHQIPRGIYLVLRDEKELTRPVRLEGSQKEWTDHEP